MKHTVFCLFVAFISGAMDAFAQDGKFECSVTSLPPVVQYYVPPQPIDTVDAVMIYAVTPNPPGPGYYYYRDSLPSWYSNVAGKLQRFIQQSSNGRHALSITILTNGTKPFLSIYNYNENGTSADQNISQDFLRNVLDSVDAHCNLAVYDKNNDGYVDFVFLIVLWARDRGVTPGLTSDWISPRTGKKVSGGGNTLQIMYTESGVLMHEYGHVLGINYDIDHHYVTPYNHYSIGSFDDMAAGGFKGVPSVYNPWFRDEFFHWIDPTIVTGDLTNRQITDLLTTNSVFKYQPTPPSNAVPNEKFYITYHEGRSEWERNWPIPLQSDGTPSGILVWRAINGTGPTDNDITNSICRPQPIDIEAAHGKWIWQEFADSVHNTGVPNPLIGFDSLEIRKIAYVNGKYREIQGPYFNKDVGSSSVFFAPNSNKEFSFYTNPNSNYLYNSSSEKYARSITSGFAVKNIRNVSGTTYIDIYTNNYTITSNTTLTAGTWYINGTVTVRAPARLTILPGAILKFAPGTSLIVNGGLTAVGTPTQPIVFTSTGGTTAGSWGSLTLDGYPGCMADLNYVNMQYGDQIKCLNGAVVAIQNTTLANNNQGVYVFNCAPQIINNKIIDPTQNGIYCDARGYDPFIQNNTITKTSSNPPYHHYTGIIVYNPTYPLIVHNDISGFDYGMYFGGSVGAYFTNDWGDIFNPNNRIKSCNEGLVVGWGSFALAG